MHRRKINNNSNKETIRGSWETVEDVISCVFPCMKMLLLKLFFFFFEAETYQTVGSLVNEINIKINVILNNWLITNSALAFSSKLSLSLRRRIGWIIQDFRETCVLRSLMLRLETKCRGAKPPRERREPSCLQLWRQTGSDRDKSGSTKRWIFKSMWNI